VQGVATALVLSCAPALATLLFAESRRVTALGSYASLTALASVVAPLIGGAAIAAMGWSGAFWFRAPLALLALLLLPLLPHLHQPLPSPQRGAPNLAGSALLATSLAFLLLTPALLDLTASGWFALLTGTIGLLALCAFVNHELRAPDPILPLALIRDPDFVIPNLASVLVQFVAFAVPLLVPYYLTRIAGYAPLESGAVLALSPAGILIGSALAAKTVGVLGVRKTALLGGTLVAGGSVAIALWSKIPSLSVILGTLALHGAGIGLFQVAYTDIVVAALPRGDRGVAGSLTMVTRTAGVITAATALTALLHVIERRQGASGTSEAVAFVDAFAGVFLCAALLLAAFFALSGMRRRT
jgi:MFS family permease